MNTQPKKKKLPTWAWIIIVIVGLAIVGNLLPETDKKEAKPADQSAPVASAAPTQTPIVVSAKQLAKDYQANEVSADDKHKGKPIQVTGQIESINKDFADDVYVIIEGDSETFTNLHCRFEDASIAAGFTKGQKVTLNGTGAGMVIGSPVLDDCTLSN